MARVGRAKERVNFWAMSRFDGVSMMRVGGGSWWGWEVVWKVGGLP